MYRKYNLNFSELQKRFATEIEYSQLKYEKVLKKYVKNGIKWLDLGCGHSILPDWGKNEEASIRNGCSLICGLDYEYESLLKNESIQHKVRGDISKLPFRK